MEYFYLFRLILPVREEQRDEALKRSETLTRDTGLGHHHFGVANVKTWRAHLSVDSEESMSVCV